jgi:hypothetical protein
MRVAVQSRRGSVGGPSSMCNTGVRVEDLCKIWFLLLNKLLKLGNLADLLKGKDFISLIAING